MPVDANTVRLQELLIAQGYPLPKYGADGRWGSETSGALARWQSDHRNLVPDGSPIPQIIAALLSIGASSISAFASSAVRRANFEWNAWPRLGKAGQAAARAKYIMEGAGDQPTPGYLWCGAAAAWFLSELHSKLRFELIQSTIRLWIMGSYVPDRNLWPSDRIRLADGSETTARKFHESTGALRRWVHGADCLTADIPVGAIICVRNSTKKDPPAGGHVVLCVEPCPPGQQLVTTISGNGWGERADGSKGGGVVRNRYDRLAVRQILTPSIHDFNQSIVYLRK